MARSAEQSSEETQPDNTPQPQPQSISLWAACRSSNPLTVLEPILKRDEADILFLAGNVALVALEIIEWPVAALAVAVHAMARSRFKGLQAMATVAEEAE
jgi:hypothetical protein